MTAADISSFFKESNSSLGLFYPTHYIVAVYPSAETALNAQKAILSAGVGKDEILAPAPSDALTFLQDFREQSGVTGNVMRSVSRFLGDDATFADRDIEHARMGAGFLFVHATTDDEMKRFSDIARTFQPVTMRYYRQGAIESLV